MGLYEARVLSYIESRTAAVHFACTSHLDHIDKVQKRFLRELGISEEEALVKWKLAPLGTRRDIAIPGVLHRTALGGGPQPFESFLHCVRHEGVANIHFST